MGNRKAVVMVWSAMGIALLAGGATLAHADKGGGKIKGNPMDIGAIHNIVGKIGNQGIGNGPASGNSGRPSQALSPAGAVPGFSNGGGRSFPGAENGSPGSKHVKDVKELQVKDFKEFRTRDVKEVRVKDGQDTQGEKDRDFISVAKTSNTDSNKSRDTAEGEAVRSETETKAVRSAPLPSCT